MTGGEPAALGGGYRTLWYRSSQKRDEDCAQRRRDGAGAGLAGGALQAPGRRPFRTNGQAHEAGTEVLQREGADRWLRVRVEADVVKRFVR